MPWFFITFVFFALWLNYRIALNSKQEKERKAQEKAYVKANVKSVFAHSRPLDEEMILRLDERDFPFRHNYREENATEYDLMTTQKKVWHHLSAPLIKTDIPTTLEIRQRFGNDQLQYIIDGEENYTRLLHYLNKWAAQLIAVGNTPDAEIILKKTIAIGSDISETYVLLYRIYDAANRKSDMAALKRQIDTLPDITRARVYKAIQ